MSATAPTKLSETASTLNRVEVFAAGVFRGKEYTVADLDDMVEAFERYSAPGVDPKNGKVDVPGVLGHTEDQAVLQNTGLEAAAWAERLYREGVTLFADLTDVPPQVMALIKGRRYRKVSAEVYDQHPDGLPTAGTPRRMLRRIAFLGGEIPQVKTLADIPIPHSEPPPATAAQRAFRLKPVRTSPGSVPGSHWCFSEVEMTDDVTAAPEQTQGTQQTPDLDALKRKLQEHGMAPEVIEKLAPEAVAEMVRLLDAARAEKQAEEKEKPVPVEEEKQPDQGSMIDKDSGPEKMAAHHAMMASMYAGRCGTGQKYSEQYKPLADLHARLAAHFGKQPGVTPQGVTMLSERDRRDLACAQADIAEAKRLAGERLASEKRAAIDAELDAAVKGGRLLPAQRDARRATLLALDAREKVHKFSENGKEVAASQLDLALHELRTGPVVFRFSERLGTVKDGAASEDAEVAKVEAHYEQFAERFEGKLTKARLVEGFKAERKSRPRLTAEEFLSV